MAVPTATIRFSRLMKWIVVLVVILMSYVLFEMIHEVALALFGSVVVSYIFYPVITWMTLQFKWARIWAIVCFYLIVTVFVAGSVMWLVPMLMSQYQLMRQELPQVLNRVQQITFTFGDINIEIGTELRQVMSNIVSSVPARVPRLFVGFIEGFLHALAFVITTFYLLLHGRTLVTRIYHLVPSVHHGEVKHVMLQIHSILSGYIRGTLLLIPIMAVLTTVALWFLGVRYALLIGLISGIVEILPIVGPWSAAAFAIIMALFQTPLPFGGEAWVVAAVIGSIYFGLRMFEDYVIIPAVVGPAVHLHPVLVIAAILSGAAVGGVLGLFLAIPVTAVLQYVLRWLYTKLMDDTHLPVVH
ncbi:MAG: AI-2E family transporter [Roseiflexaceae bacterium]